MKNQQGFIPIILLLLVILVAGAAGTFLLLNQNQKNNLYTSPTPLTSSVPVTYTTSPSQQTNQTDFPPLYPNVQWGQVQQGEYIFRNQDLTTVKKEGYYVETTQAYMSNDVDNFLKYYKTKLEAGGWQLVGVAGGGVEEVDDYKKADSYFQVRSKGSPGGSKLIVTYSK